MHIMVFNILPHMQPHSHMWRDTIELQIMEGGRIPKNCKGGEEKQMRETNIQILERLLEPMTSRQTKLWYHVKLPTFLKA